MSYRNPVTYVDSQSGKYFASAIKNISNTASGIIDTIGAKAEAERKKKEEENFKLLNDVTKYNLDYLNNANLASKDFDLQPALQPALSVVVDQGSRIKAQLLNSKNPAERAQLQAQLSQYESFFKGGGMRNLLESFQEKRELFSKLMVTGKAGSEGGIDMKKLDPKLAKFFMSTFNDTLPSDLGINIVNNNGVFDIVLNSTGGQFGKEGGYQQSLMALMSADLPTIPGMTAESENALFEGQIVDAKTRRVTAKGMATYLQGSGKKDVGSNTFEFYEFSNKGKELFRKNMRANVLSTLAGYSNQNSLMDGPGSGFNSIESYYNNVLRQKGDPDLKIGNAEGTSLDKDSLDRVIKYMTNNLEKTFEQGINPALLKKSPPSKTNSKQVELQEGLQLALYLQKTTLPLFKNLDTSMDLLKEIDKYTSVDISQETNFGKDGKSVSIGSGKNKQNITSDMTQGQIKAAILRATGLPQSIISQIDFSDIAGLQAVFGLEIDKLSNNLGNVSDLPE